ncbi:MAG: hypothetical protein KZQ90_13430 [Candidatus Thiodiazotropha sp. (ex Codakia rugifera)]|nr:hypothetical protein [Candidatus Thiodiazotropha sp. (ex Codakia rugifera)]
MDGKVAMAFVSEVREAFPESAARADALMVRRGYESDEITEMYTMWLSAFADITGEEMVAEATYVVELHFAFFSGVYENGSDRVRRLVDVGYVENLFWRIPKEVCARFWPSMPVNLQQLYVGFHGSPPF